jgi:hypothetical protein
MQADWVQGSFSRSTQRHRTGQSFSGADTCVGSSLDPVMKFDANGRMVTNFGGFGQRVHHVFEKIAKAAIPRRFILLRPAASPGSPLCAFG